MSIGNQISAIRKEQQLTQEHFGELFHVTRQTVSNWENEKSYPDLQILIAMSNQFDVSLDTLLKGDSKMGKNEKTKKPKPKYNVWQNTAYMLSVAWDTRRSVPLLVVLLAVCTAGKTTAEMLISPAVLGKLESGAPLGQLLGAIGGFTILLFALTALCYYIDHLTMFGRCGVRLELLKRINTKRTRTAYANLLDEAFRLMYQKGHDACMNNRASGEAFWKSWTDILTNLIGFGVYLALLSGLNPWLCVLTALTAVVSYFSTRNINEWGYRHREEGAKITRSLHYLRNTAEGREFGKDIRIFGLRHVHHRWHIR